ncbi:MULTISPECIES: hypothetical protein [Mycolicibacter]|uniref:hypothetical protein n=1 Tax=Mycolicibacter TaxID=1073531 RepID=UPI0010545E63|nr:MULTISPECIES: hypothetical protein [Mycolicibacter]
MTRRSLLTGVERTLELAVTAEQLEAWKAGGELIQDALPHLTASEREFLVSGVTPDEWAEHLSEPM